MLPFRFRRIRRSWSILSISLFVAACVQDSPAGPATSSAAAKAPVGGGEDEDLSPVEAFDLHVQVNGRLAPGLPIVVVASARAKIKSKSATLRIAAPELESARRSGWDRAFRVPLGEKVSPALEFPVVLAEGDSRTFSTTLLADRAGMYRVVVSAVAEADEANRGSGVQWSVHKEFWLLIDSAGGRAMDTFDPSVAPRGTVPQPGPWRRLTDRANLSLRPNNESRLMTSDGSDHYRVVFYDSDSVAFLALPGLTAEYDVYTDDGFGGSVITDHGWSGTDANGYMTIECNQMWVGQTYLGMLRFSNSLVVISNQYTFFGVSGAGGVDACGTWSSAGSPYQVIAANSAAARVFTTLTNTIPISRSYFGNQRSQVAVKVYTDSGTSNYSAGADDIEIYGNAVWTGWGKYTATHEYGHALHEKGLGGNAASGNCPSGGHHIGQLTNLKCAFSEGFADYHARAVGSLYFGLEGID